MQEDCNNAHHQRAKKVFIILDTVICWIQRATVSNVEWPRMPAALPVILSSNHPNTALHQP
jgi:hypothetical protein